ncbi:hypothetical protein Ancab_026438 [Ancistrocladus abbreviatus]
MEHQSKFQNFRHWKGKNHDSRIFQNSTDSKPVGKYDGKQCKIREIKLQSIINEASKALQKRKSKWKMNLAVRVGRDEDDSARSPRTDRSSNSESESGKLRRISPEKMKLA